MSCLPTINGKRYKNIRDLIVQNNLEKKALDYFKIKSINEQKVEPSRQLDLFEDSTPELQDFFSGLEKYTGKTPSKNGLKTIPNNITSISKFEGTPIEYVDLIGYTPSGVRIGARNINRGEKILVDLEAMKEKFESKAWATTTQTVPLAEDAFKTYQELIMFMFLHEKAHEYILQNPLETKYDYENRVNEEALRRLQEEYDTTTQTEEGLEYSPIKEEGVKELFESNPELANNVYKALGLNIIDGSEITYTDEEGNPCAKMGLTNTTKGTDWKIVKDFKGQPKHSQGGVDITISDKGVTMRRGGKDIKAKFGLLIAANGLNMSNPDKPPFDEWYKTVPKEKNDTTNYNLRRAYELAPKEQLDEFVKNPDAHLYSVYENPKTGEYEFMKSKNHPTLKYEIDWYNSEEGKEFRGNYDLDTSGEYYKYIPKNKTNEKN